MGSRGRSRTRQQKKHRQSTGTGDASALKTDAPPSSEKVDVILKPTSATSAVSSAPLRRRTLRVGGLVALTTAIQGTAFLTAVFYFFGGALLFCVISLGSFLLLLQFVASSESDPENEMWTMTQFETLGALRVDTYLRYLVTKLAILWRSIVTLHKSAVNYQFTVSIAETPSLVELQDLLETRVPLLLTYDDAASTDDEGNDSRRSSIASTVVMEEGFGMRASMDMTAIEDTHVEIQEVEEYYAIENYVPDYDDNDYWSEVEEEPAAQEDVGHVELTVLPEEKEMEVVSAMQQPEDNQAEHDVDATVEKVVEGAVQSGEKSVDVVEVEEAQEATPEEDADETPAYTDVKREIAALRSILVPMLPLTPLLKAHNALMSASSAASSAQIPMEPIVKPLVKPLILKVEQAKWEPEAPVLATTKPTLKRRISVTMPSAKPHPRLVVKARPSTLTPPENVQRMLNQVERMMQEVHELLAIGNEVLGRAKDADSTHKTRRHSHKEAHVRFSDDVQLIDSKPPANVETEEEEEELRSSLHYLPEEIEFMSDEFFRSSIDDDVAALC